MSVQDFQTVLTELNSKTRGAIARGLVRRIQSLGYTGVGQRVPMREWLENSIREFTRPPPPRPLVPPTPYMPPAPTPPSLVRPTPYIESQEYKEQQRIKKYREEQHQRQLKELEQQQQEIQKKISDLKQKQYDEAWEQFNTIPLPDEPAIPKPTKEGRRTNHQFLKDLEIYKLLKYQ
jgi:hypothetical protein